MNDWNPAKFNWAHVRRAPQVDPSRPFVLVLGVAIGVALAGPLVLGLSMLGALALMVVGEYAYVATKAARRERARLRRYRETH
jgi:hypothetical protein